MPRISKKRLAKALEQEKKPFRPLRSFIFKTPDE